MLGVLVLHQRQRKTPYHCLYRTSQHHRSRAVRHRVSATTQRGTPPSSTPPTLPAKP